jgi:hypothetical protein
VKCSVVVAGRVGGAFAVTRVNKGDNKWFYLSDLNRTVKREHSNFTKCLEDACKGEFMPVGHAVFLFCKYLIQYPLPNLLYDMPFCYCTIVICYAVLRFSSQWILRLVFWHVTRCLVDVPFESWLWSAIQIPMSTRNIKNEMGCCNHPLKHSHVFRSCFGVLRRVEVGCQCFGGSWCFHPQGRNVSLTGKC